jgi:RNA polymerase sigma factor (sigma-70 family)
MDATAGPSRLFEPVTSRRRRVRFLTHVWPRTVSFVATGSLAHVSGTVRRMGGPTWRASISAMTDEQFTAIWESTFPRLFRYCQFRTASVADAEDLAAEAFSRLLTQPPMPEAKVLPWLYRVAMNVHVDRIRATKRETLVADLTGLAGVVEQWTDPGIGDAVRRLAPAQQLVVYLRMVEDRSFSEVGAALGRSEGAAKMLYRRALDRLGVLLEVTDHERRSGARTVGQDRERLQSASGGALREAGAREAGE